MCLLLVRLAGLTLADALTLTFDEAGLWLDEALSLQRELTRDA